MLEVADGVAAHEILRGVLAGDAVVVLPRDELHRREQKSEHDAGAVRGRGGRAQGAGGVTTSRDVSGHGETTVKSVRLLEIPSAKPDRVKRCEVFPGGRPLGLVLAQRGVRLPLARESA